jgi:trans-aconitate methyltransferase
MNSAYDIDPDQISPETSHGKAIALAGDARTVLDIGCSSGGVGREFMSRGATVIGLDIEPDAVAKACARGVDARVWDLETESIAVLASEGPFDAVVFADVLEHLRDPQEQLVRALPLLSDTGCVIVSVPNVAHVSIRLAMILGRWDYRDYGLLDTTHLRFFTLDGLEDLAESAGYYVDTIERTFHHVENVGDEVLVDELNVPPWIVAAARYGPEANTHQFIARLRPIVSDVADVDVLRHALQRARMELRAETRMNRVLRSEHEALIQRAEAGDRARLDALATKDALVGLQAVAASRDAAEEWARVSEKWAQALQREVDELRRALDDVTGSLTWKIGRIATLPLRAVRKILRGFAR